MGISDAMNKARTRRRVQVLLGTLLPVVLVCSLAGCEKTAYIFHVAGGQLGVQANVEPIEDVLASGRLTPEQEAKLRLIVEIRQFAIDHIGLNAGESYTTFYDTSGEPLAFNLSAARKDALEPFAWQFPVVGAIPYLGFFDLDYTQSVQQGLIDLGYDTVLYEVDAYSTLGLFADPVRSPMLERDEISLADTITHELLHNTIWRVNDAEFNESLATFVGRTGGLEFLRSRFGEDSALAAAALDYYADLDVINAFLSELFADLQAYYAGPLSSQEKIAGREAIYQAGRDRFATEVLPHLSDPVYYAALADFPTNNAWMLGNRRYNLDLDLFEAVFHAAGDNWPESLDVYGQAAAGDDPQAFLRRWLADRGLTPPAKPRHARRILWADTLVAFPILTLPGAVNRLSGDRPDGCGQPIHLKADQSCRLKRLSSAPASELPGPPPPKP